MGGGTRWVTALKSQISSSLGLVIGREMYIFLELPNGAVTL